MISSDALTASVKALGYQVIKTTNKRVVVAIAGGDRRAELKKIAAQLGGTYNPVNSASSTGAVQFANGLSIIAKPAKGTGNRSEQSAELTRLVESAQCLYCASGSKFGKFDAESLKKSTDLVKIDEKPSKCIMELPDDWTASSVAVAQALNKKFGGKRYTFHRGSKWVQTLNQHFYKLNAIDKTFTNINKWNPADIWLVSDAGAQATITKTTSIVELNALLLDNLRSNDIIGVSLKKTSGSFVQLSEINTKASKTKYHYTGYNLGKRGFFLSKDLWITYNDGEIQFRTSGSEPRRGTATQIQFRSFPTWQGEIKGKIANHGKISGGPLSVIVERLTGAKMYLQREITEPEIFVDDFYKWYQYLEKQHVLPYDEFLREVRQLDFGWYVSKFLGTQLIYQTEVSSKQDEIVAAIINYAASQSELSGPYVKVQ